MKTIKKQPRTIVLQQGDIQLKIVATSEGFNIAAKDVKTKDFVVVGHVRNSQTGDGLMVFPPYKDMKEF